MTNLTEALKQFNYVLNQFAPDVANRLQPGLNFANIRRAISKFSWSLPQDGYALYQWHNGLLWMLFATTAKVREMHRVIANQEHHNVLSGIGHLKLVGIWVISLPRIISIIFKSLRMKKRLVVEELSKLKEQPIIEIRREHGIVL